MTGHNEKIATTHPSLRRMRRRSTKLHEAMRHIGRESDPKAYLQAVLNGVIDPKTGRRREAT